jgi:hypothetical protein
LNLLLKVPSSPKVVVGLNLLLKGGESRCDAKSGRLRSFRDRRVGVEVAAGSSSSY